MPTMTELHEPETLQAETLKPAASEIESPRSTPFVGPPLFAHVLLEMDGAEKGRRKWSALSSLALQCLVLGALLVVPLMFTDALPKQQLLTLLVAPPPPPPPPPPAAPTEAQVIRHVTSNVIAGELRTPSRIPNKVQMIKEEEAPPIVSGEGVVGGVPGGIPGGQIGGVIGGIVGSTSSLPALPKLAPPPKRLRVSEGVIAGLLVHRVEPTYPMLARQARIQGEVLLKAVISKDGTITNLQVVTGHPMLVPAALAAVQQWRYRPFLVTGEPVEVEAVISVTFRFSN